MTNQKNGTLYIGVTNDLIRRVDEHRRGVMLGFTKRYGLKRLVWFDVTDDVGAAIWCEKKIKWWKRSWKIELIEKSNPDWNDLWDEINQ